MKQTVSDYLQIGISLGPSDCTYSILADQVSDLLHRAVNVSLLNDLHDSSIMHAAEFNVLFDITNCVATITDEI